MEGKCNALLLADRVIVENNGKKGIIGEFNTYNFPTFPAVAPPFFVFAILEDFEGTQEFTVNIVRDGVDYVVMSLGGELNFQDPAKEIELILPVAGITFPKDGLYNMILKVGNYSYGSRHLFVNRIMPGPIGG